MEINRDALLWLVDNGSSQKFEMQIGNSTYDVASVKFAYSETSVSKPTIRGGVYFSDKMGFKMKVQLPGNDVSKVLSKTMLGPNTDFEKIQFLTALERNGNKEGLRIFANLVNYVQRGSNLELNLTVMETESAG